MLYLCLRGRGCRRMAGKGSGGFVTPGSNSRGNSNLNWTERYQSWENLKINIFFKKTDGFWTARMLKNAQNGHNAPKHAGNRWFRWFMTNCCMLGIEPRGWGSKTKMAWGVTAKQWDYVSVRVMSVSDHHAGFFLKKKSRFALLATDNSHSSCRSEGTISRPNLLLDHELWPIHTGGHA